MRDELSSGSQELRVRFIARFQQTTGPVMAKGTEDTAFYQFNRLVSSTRSAATRIRSAAR